MTSSRSFTFTEDWVVVILGIATIFLALSGIVAPVPRTRHNGFRPDKFNEAF